MKYKGHKYEWRCGSCKVLLKRYNDDPIRDRIKCPSCKEVNTIIANCDLTKR